jgi:3-oxoacyl-[acyl-carrier-protein] synthase II
MHRVVVTGAGIVSPIGSSVPEFARKMFTGESGSRAIRGKMVADDFPASSAAPVDLLSLRQVAVLLGRDPEKTPKFWSFAGLATEEALQALPKGLPIDAIVYGNMEGLPFALIKGSFQNFSVGEFDWDLTLPETSLNLIQRILKHRGHPAVDDRNLIGINNACVSANQAIGLAAHRIRSGQWTRAVTGAVFAYCNDSELMNFVMLGALTTADVPPAEASRPFSKDRSGFVLGEGAATLILESEEEAQARGAPILGYVSGYGATSDSYRITDGRPDGKAAAEAMRRTARDAALPLEALSAISAHGTSTRLNDRIETLAIKIALGSAANAVPVISLKSQVGNSTFAAGALEAVACLMMIQEQTLAPTINYKDPDPECDLDYVPNRSRPTRVQRVMSNSFGFGGQNACLLFEKDPSREAVSACL